MKITIKKFLGYSHRQIEIETGEIEYLRMLTPDRSQYLGFTLRAFIKNVEETKDNA